MTQEVGPSAEALSVQSLREKVMRHCDEFLSLPIDERSATGLKAVVDAIVALGEVVERREVQKTRSAMAALPFPVETFGNESPVEPANPRAERKSAKGDPIPGVDL